MSLGNLPDYVRTHVNSIKLVALCKKEEFNHEKVYGKIVEDLKKLETEGIQIGGHILKGGLVFITGDNLGTHGLGGFTENFSTVNYLCRFCMMTRSEFECKGGAARSYRTRTVELHKEALEKLEDTLDLHCEGIKFDSFFNKLDHYHVFNPGLPPCLGHDLFEGVVAYDLKIYIDYFIKKKMVYI